MPIHWETNYKVGINKLDEQHKIFIDLINQLHEANANARTLAVPKRIIRNLISYTDMHFKDEERMLASVGYIRLRSHRNAHHAFSRQLARFAESVNDGESEAAVALANYLDDWLANHLDTVDPLYVAFLKERNLKPSL